MPRFRDRPQEGSCPARWALALLGSLLGSMALTSSVALGQAGPSLTVPPAVMVLNPDREFPGLWESLEAGAVLARVGDPAAIWYNPAGMIFADRSAINANAPGYEFTAFSGSGFDDAVRGSNLRTLPNFVGVILGKEVIPWRDFRVGFGVTNPVSWHQGLTVASTPSPEMRSTYDVTSDLQSFQASAALAYQPLPHLRLGASLGFSYDTISTVGQIAAESTTAALWQGSMSSSIISANTQQFVSSIGIQYEVVRWLMVGAVIRPPALRILGNAQITYNSIASTTGEQRQLYFDDSGARFELRQPLQISMGGAVRVGPSAQIELDVAWHQASGAYDLFASSQLVHLVTVPAGGVSPTVTNRPFPDVRSQTRAILNGSLGGLYKLDKSWTLHSGLYVNQAATEASDPFFLPIDFYGLRMGGAFQSTNLAVSLGVGYEIGVSKRPVGVGTLPGDPAPEADGRLAIHTVSLLLAVGYSF